jgi:hypothetical protein
MEQFDWATLYTGTDHPWRIRRSSDYKVCILLGQTDQQMARFIDLADGRGLCRLDHVRATKTPDGTPGQFEEQFLVVVGRPKKYFDKFFQKEAIGMKRSEVKVIAKGLEQLFERILNAEGRYFFDEPGFTPEDGF